MLSEMAQNLNETHTYHNRHKRVSIAYDSQTKKQRWVPQDYSALTRKKSVSEQMDQNQGTSLIGRKVKEAGPYHGEDKTNASAMSKPNSSGVTFAAAAVQRLLHLHLQRHPITLLFDDSFIGH